MAGVDRLSIGEVDITGALDYARKATGIVKVVNKLLNGQPNIQIIGQSGITFAVHFYADQAGHDTLDTACVEGTELTLHYHGSDYVGLIEEGEMPWAIIIEDEGNEWFEVEFTLRVIEVL